MPHEPARPPTSPTDKSRPITPIIQQHIHPPPPKSFVLSQYTCKGFTQFNSSDYDERGRPRCYGIEQKIMSSVQLQDQFRSMLKNDGHQKLYDKDDFFDNFKRERGKIIAESGEDGDGTFKYRGYGTTRYPVMEYTDGTKRESITLQKPVVDPGLMVAEEEDGDTYFVFKISGYEISNDVRGMYDDEMRRPDDVASTKNVKNQRKHHDNERDLDRHMVEIEIDLDKTGEKIWEIASKTVENAKKVGGIVTEEIQDDFIPRVSQMSQRIVNQFPKTAVRCKKTAEDIFKWWQQADEDDEE